MVIGISMEAIQCLLKVLMLFAYVILCNQTPLVCSRTLLYLQTRSTSQLIRHAIRVCNVSGTTICIYLRFHVENKYYITAPNSDNKIIMEQV
jgi:hypothetical protein